MPLHPALVHLPLGLAVVMPLMAITLAVGVARHRIRYAWLLVVLLQACLVGAGLLALQSGETEEERVEAVVPGALLEAHERAGQLFVTAAGIALLLAASPLVLRGRARSVAAAVASAATVVVAGLGVRVGHAGGELVYVHGAAQVYSPAGGQNVTSNRAVPAPAREDDD